MVLVVCKTVVGVADVPFRRSQIDEGSNSVMVQIVQSSYVSS